MNEMTSISQLDFFATNIEYPMFDEKIEPFNISDHHELFFTLTIDMPPEPPIVKSKDEMIYEYDTRENNIYQLCKFFQDEDFNTVYECMSDVNLAYNSFYRIIVHALDLKCPMKKIKPGGYKNDRKTWITNEMENTGRQLKDMYWLVKNTKEFVLANEYQEKIKEHKKDINHSKRIHYQNRVNNVKSSQEKQRQVWKIVGEESEKNAQNSYSEKIKIGNETIEDSPEIANYFAEYSSATVAENIKLHFDSETGTTGNHAVN
ncbi:hypothetical protein JTB14_013243 [Gonioctena quinquepunctata]|nr:hypothetical protein JTB14_013243 [Gonioctena quinquepunctata]